MSSNDGHGNDRKKAPISNPYARKRKPPPDSQNPTTTTNRTASTDPGTGAKAPASSASGLAPVAVGYAATFSQAFESIEDTSHYKKQYKNATPETQVEKARAEQRALDSQEQAAAIAATRTGNDPNQLISDKDHHVLLQQPHVLYVSTRQRGNGILNYIRNVPFSFSKMVPDYIMGPTSCALFLSLKYHHLYPNYIHRRIAELSNMFRLRVLLALVDVTDNAQALLRLNKIAVTNNLTLILAWSEQEAARYLETYKALDGKDASSIQRKEQTNFVDQVADFLTGCKPVNKTDAANLLDHFSTIHAIAAANKDELALCPGLGQVKVQKLYDAFHKPFSKRRALERKKKRQAEEEAKKKEAEDEETKQKPTEAAENDAVDDGVEAEKNDDSNAKSEDKDRKTDSLGKNG